MRVLVLAAAVFFSTAAIAGDAKPKYKSKPVKNPKEVKTADGLIYTITAQGDGPMPKAGDKVTAHYTGTLEDGTKFDSSVDRGLPFSFKLGAGQVIKGWDEAFALMHAGDKAKLRIPAELGYGANANGKIPANATLLFDVELLDIAAAPTPWVVKKGMDTITTASGLKYILFHTTKDSMASKGDEVKMHYSGFLTDGKLFDSSVERGDPLPFTVGMHQVIPGWDEAALLLHKGDKAKLIIPGNLAYGDRGYPGVIPPNATLVFDVELMEITKKEKPKPYDITGLTSQKTPGGTEVYFVKKGDGPACTPGSRVSVHYTGMLTNGEIFDSSIPRKMPYTLTLGQHSVIAGWEEALLMAHMGDKLHVVIPYQQGYGEAGRPPQIPPKATLVFDMEVVGCTK